jgi:hypothetical protein
VLIKTLTKGRNPIRKACYQIRIPNIFSDYPKVMKFNVSPDLHESIDIWVHEFTEWALYILIVRYTGWTVKKMDKGFHAYNKEKFVPEHQTIHHVITSLHTINVIENNHNELFVVNCDEYFDLIDEKNHLNIPRLTDWLIVNIE